MFVSGGAGQAKYENGSSAALGPVKPPAWTRGFGRLAPDSRSSSRPCQAQREAKATLQRFVWRRGFETLFPFFSPCSYCHITFSSSPPFLLLLLLLLSSQGLFPFGQPSIVSQTDLGSGSAVILFFFLLLLTLVPTTYIHCTKSTGSITHLCKHFILTTTS